ncbi:MAG: LysM peptidoglycan-binding domain-containing protein [Thermoleophilia bacterium]|nr:LysM peptidoglycan-binding domain-containing protein [Thermoleophilia bacterium]
MTVPVGVGGGLGEIAQFPTNIDFNNKESQPTQMFAEIADTVATRDTLSAIAQSHYNDPTRWPLIFSANQRVWSNPNEINPGQVLRAPISS